MPLVDRPPPVEVAATPPTDGQLLLQVGVLNPAAFASTPFDQVDITCEIKPDHVSFLSHDDGTVHHFPRELFLIEWELPQAAA